MSCNGIKRGVGYNRPIVALGQPISGTWLRGRRMEAYPMLSVMKWSETEAARFAARRKGARSIAESGSSSFSQVR